MMFILGVTINLALHVSADLALIGGYGLALFAGGALIVAYRVRRSRHPLHFNLLKQDYRARFTSGLIPWIVRFLTIVMSRDFFALLFMLLILGGLAEAILYIFSGAATVWFLLIIGSTAAAMTPLRPALGRGQR
jgi:CDP-L-myo-inositol myo-inositolphosphotransferase